MGRPAPADIMARAAELSYGLDHGMPPRRAVYLAAALEEMVRDCPCRIQEGEGLVSPSPYIQRFLDQFRAACVLGRDAIGRVSGRDDFRGWAAAAIFEAEDCNDPRLAVHGA